MLLGISAVVIIVQLLASLFILIYGISQLFLVIKSTQFKQEQKQPLLLDEDLPFVTIQLPVYNEKYVVERLIDAVVALKYPHDKLEIQVLDDSDDETVEMVSNKVSYFQSKGVDIKHIRRSDRVGFKAGALQHGLETAKGEFIAILDADFVPQEEFLLQVLPHFNEPKTGMVQARWGHLNKSANLLTRLQAFGLDAHFNIEQHGRLALGGFINFNGTAGIWRKSCILAAGGWQHDTLTEDLDLSYRAQLLGWKLNYVNSVEVPAELPPVLKALQNQQFRWTKGAAQNLVKHGASVLKANKIGFLAKLMALLHLSNALVFAAVFFMVLSVFPLLLIKHYSIDDNLFRIISSFFIPGMICLIIFYWQSFQYEQYSGLKKLLYFLVLFPLFLAFSMGLSLQNTRAVLQGLMGKKSPFIRTPKVSMNGSIDDAIKNTYFQFINTFSIPIEFFITMYLLFSFSACIYLKELTFIPFILMLLLGFGSIAIIKVNQYFTMK